VVHRDIRYASPASAVLDVYSAGARRRGGVPGVLVVHGGGWRFGDKGKMAVAARALARAGLVAFNVNYSLATPARAGFPGQLMDLRAALRWIRRRAPRYGADPRRLGALGSSAGAHLAALLGVTGAAGSPAAPGLRAIVMWSAPFDLTSPDASALAPAIASFLGCAPRACPGRAIRASPLTHVTRDDPPMLMFASEAEFVPVGQARAMAARLADAGVPHRLSVLAGAAHGMAYADVALGPSIDFLRRRLR
jgi:acetyl esterase/lipase